MMTITFVKDHGNNPYDLTIDPDSTYDSDQELLVSFIESIAAQSAVVTIFKGHQMVAIYNRNIRGWVTSDRSSICFRQVINLIRGSLPMAA